jgi:hypothetical protein
MQLQKRTIFPRFEPRPPGYATYKGNLPDDWLDHDGLFYITNEGTLRLSDQHAPAGNATWVTLPTAPDLGTGLHQQLETRFLYTPATMDWLLGADATNKHGYVFRQQTNFIFLYRYVGGVLSASLANSGLVSLTLGTEYILRARRTYTAAGTVSHLYAEICTPAAPFTSLASVSLDETTPVELRTAGVVGLSVPTLDTVSVRQIRNWTYTSDGTFEAGWASLENPTAGIVELWCQAPLNASGAVTYTWHRSTTAGFTPSGATEIGTGQKFIDTTAEAGTRYFWRCVQTTATAQSATSNEAGGVVEQTPLGIMVIGDSLWGWPEQEGHSAFLGNFTTETAAPKLERLLSEMLNRRVVVYNAAVLGTTTAHWQPGAAPIDTVGNLNAKVTAAIAAFDAAGVLAGERYAQDSLGVNDAINGVTAGTFLANSGSIRDYVLANGFSKFMLAYPTATHGPIQTNALTLEYNSEIDSLIAGNTIAGPSLIFDGTLANPSDRMDTTHTNAAGKRRMVGQFAERWAEAVVVSQGGPIAIYGGQTDYGIGGPTTDFTLAFPEQADGVGTITITAIKGTLFVSSPGDMVGNNTSNVVVTPLAGATNLTFAFTGALAGTGYIGFANTFGWTNPSTLAVFIIGSAEYADDSDLDDWYGTLNIDIYSNLDNTTTTRDTARIYKFLAKADAWINLAFKRVGRSTPIATDADDFTALTDVAAEWAGAMLAKGRGDLPAAFSSRDAFDGAMDGHIERAQARLKELVGDWVDAEGDSTVDVPGIMETVNMTFGPDDVTDEMEGV